MRRVALLVAVSVFALSAVSAIAGSGPAPNRATREECVAFVKRAVEYYKANGSAKAFAAFTDPTSEFHEKDLYILVNDDHMVTLAHGLIPQLVGRSRMDEQDADGKYYLREKIEKMKTEKAFWTDYKYTDPVTHKIAQKSSYCEVVTDPVLRNIMICSGVYAASKL